MIKLLIAIPSNTGRFVLPVPFSISLADMCQNLPEGVKADIHYFGGLRIDAVRNQVAQYCITNEYDFLLFLDDDMAFPADTIQRLFAHDKLIVSGLYGAKSMPFHYFVMPEDNKPADNNDWLREIEPKLYEVKSLATGCLLINCEVFQTISRPFFLLRMDLYGRITQTEDCFFAQMCRLSEVKMYVDATIQCQHLKTVAFPQFWKNPQLHYEGETIEKNVINTEVYPHRLMKISPKAGYCITDGIDVCAHTKQTKMVNGLFVCRDCGLVADGLDFFEKAVVEYDDYEELERVSDGN